MCVGRYGDCNSRERKATMMNRFSRREFLKLGTCCALPVSPLLAAAADPATLKIRSVEAHVLRIGRRSDIFGGLDSGADDVAAAGEPTRATEGVEEGAPQRPRQSRKLDL